MRIWIDLANSPHALFFAPIIGELTRCHVDILCTARDFAQTTGLADLYGIQAVTIGRHGGSGTGGKAGAIISRAAMLRKFALECRPHLAVGHNSYSQCLAAWSLGVPSITIMDYEHTPANHLSFRLARRIVLPAAISLTAVRKYGATAAKVIHYDGFKEQIYLAGHAPDRELLESLLPGMEWERLVIVVARPPADFAIYHRFKNPLFDTWLQRVGRDDNSCIVLLPRTGSQRERYLRMQLPSVVIPDRDLPGPDLLCSADLVVSAGGTMNREAAILGTPAYSIFAGEEAAVDRELSRLGRLTFIRNEDDVHRIRLEKKKAGQKLTSPRHLAEMVDLIMGSAATLTGKS